jgi:hypothetical protein
MIANLGRTLLAILGLTSIASTALAQGNTFNPYGNSGYADYREFGNPMYSNNPALPGQALLNSQPFINRPRANNFQQYAEDLDGVEIDRATPSRGASSSVPYYQAYQRLNSEYNRVYKPNNTKEDREYTERLKKREQDYANAMKKREQDYARAFGEKDPVKRAKLLRLIELESLDRPSATKGSAGPRATATGPSASPRPSTSSGRRTTAPPPISTDATRRSGTTAPSATRAPAPPSGTGRSTAPPPLTSRPSTSRAPDPSTIPIPPPR